MSITDFNPFYILAIVVLVGLVFVVMIAGRRRKTGSGSPTPIAPGSKETPVSGAVTDPKKHTK
jgi:hypothetical protein